MIVFERRRQSRHRQQFFSRRRVRVEHVAASPHLRVQRCRTLRRHNERRGKSSAIHVTPPHQNPS